MVLEGWRDRKLKASVATESQWPKFKRALLGCDGQEAGVGAPRVLFVGLGTKYVLRKRDLNEIQVKGSKTGKQRNRQGIKGTESQRPRSRDEGGQGAQRRGDRNTEGWRQGVQADGGLGQRNRGGKRNR